ncbi:MAG: hypothetical protein WC526_00145 [Patescibacteria group bacterium]
MGKLSERDREQVLEARKANILTELADSKLMLHNGIILGGVCSDGDQLPEMKKHIGLLVEAQYGAERVHLFAINGGALALSPSSPLANMSRFYYEFLVENNLDFGWRILLLLLYPVIWFMGKAMRQDIILMINVWLGIRMKQIKTVGLCIHAPCGAAGLCGMSFVEEISCLIKAKRRLKAMPVFTNVKFPCFVHVDYGDDGNGGNSARKRTYFISTKAAEKWLLEHYPHALYS